ncbi:non-hydrolyzing UDP-N-acetylglucosamine 2-epimerase [Chitinophaga sp.]|uniref:non-hydrolyzing UDP-N-acetylglucosamine 2-epimerase n=1 Tax=Chitinophaga sp. TaxID=1869181 RepID=UPI002F94FA28
MNHIKKKKVMVVFGTRPEAIKMVPVVKELAKHSDLIDARTCVTGQHRHMLDSVLETFNIVPDFDLDIMQQSQDLHDITINILTKLKAVLKEFRPDLILVHGDTTTAFVVSLAAFYEKIQIGHVEAGLRTYNIQSPWPEEFNRQIVDKIADYCFVPTERSQANLLEEKTPASKIFVTGNSVIDTLFLALGKIENDASLKASLEKTLAESGYDISKGRQFILVTGHRRESFGDGFLNICDALKNIATRFPDIDIVYPVHLNPNVQGPVYNKLGGIDNVYLTKPLDYLPFIYLMKHCYLVLTDSGGIQEEAPSLGKPVLVMRDTTERPEAVDAGTVILVGTSAEKIFHEAELLILDNDRYNSMSRLHNPYGDGKASARIAEAILEKTAVAI